MTESTPPVRVIIEDYGHPAAPVTMPSGRTPREGLYDCGVCGRKIRLQGADYLHGFQFRHIDLPEEIR